MRKWYSLGMRKEEEEVAAPISREGRQYEEYLVSSIEEGNPVVLIHSENISPISAIGKHFSRD